jgi:hypothetical protein
VTSRRPAPQRVPDGRRGNRKKNPAGGVFIYMGADKVFRIERVRCLECGTTYSKPADGGFVSENPGCPSCDYVGWISAAVPTPVPQHRSDVDLPQRRAARSH